MKPLRQICTAICLALEIASIMYRDHKLFKQAKATPGARVLYWQGLKNGMSSRPYIFTTPLDPIAEAWYQPYVKFAQCYTVPNKFVF